MKKVYLLLTALAIMSCSPFLDFGSDINEDFQYENILVKYDASGSHDWSETLEGALQPTAMAIDSDDAILMVGTYVGQPDLGTGPFPDAGVRGLFVAKFDSTGTPIWGRGYGEVHSKAVSSGDIYAQSFLIHLDPAGNILLTGSYSVDTLDFGDGPLPYAATEAFSNGFLAKLDPEGNPLFARGFAGVDPDEESDSPDYGMAVATDSKGAIFLAASAAYPVTLAEDLIVGGNFLAAFNGEGTPLWARELNEKSGGFSLSISSDGDVLLSGGHLGPLDFGGGLIGEELSENDRAIFAARYDTEGNHLWSTSFGNNGALYSFPGGAAIFDRDDNIVVMGTRPAESNTDVSGGGYRIFVSRLNGSGETEWTTHADFNIPYFGSNADLHTLRTDGNNNIIMSGLFTGSLTFEDGNRIGSGSDGDGFVIKYDTAGEIIFALAFERAIPESSLSVGYSMVTTDAIPNSADDIILMSGCPVSD